MREIQTKTLPGSTILGIVLCLLLLSVTTLIWGATALSAASMAAGITGGTVGILVSGLLAAGFFTLQPNEAAALVLFGAYQGTVKTPGWHWANPFLSKRKISLRSRTLNGEKLKVNDKIGNPIEIAAVVVWRVKDTAQALFDVDAYEEYVSTQSESALRHLAGLYPYDAPDDHTSQISLRGSTNEVSEALKKELQERVSKAGVIVEEARLSHLAYAPEIAAAMLQRQQAEAIIAARQKIVDGAVSMVQMAIDKLNNQVVDLDEEHKAAMVSNLLIVLCSERATHPVVNVGASG